MNRISDIELLCRDIDFVSSWLVNDGQIHPGNTIDLYSIIQLNREFRSFTSISNETDIRFISTLEKYDNIKTLLNLDFINISDILITDKKDLDTILNILKDKKDNILCQKSGNLASFEMLIRAIRNGFLYFDNLIILHNRFPSDIIITELCKKYLLIELMKNHEQSCNTKTLSIQDIMSGVSFKSPQEAMKVSPKMGSSPPRMGSSPPRMGSSSKLLQEGEARIGSPRIGSSRMGSSSKLLQEGEASIGSPRIGSSRMGSSLSRMGSSPPRMGSSPPRMGSSPPRMGSSPPRMGSSSKLLQEAEARISSLDSAIITNSATITRLIKEEQEKIIPQSSMVRAYVTKGRITIIDDIMVKINEIIDGNITQQNIQYLFKKVDYTVLCSRLIVRHIDILLHYTPIEESIQLNELRMVEILQRLPREIIIGIFNDPTVSYPYSNRPYLNTLKTATMSSMLVSQFIDIYHYVLTTFPDVEVNPVSDLKLILSQLLALGSSPYIDIYKNIIKNLIQRLRLIDENLFSNEWFAMLFDTLTIALQHSKDFARKRDILLTPASFLETVRFNDSWTRSIFNNPKSKINLISLFKNYNSWETFMIVDTNEINFLDSAENINKELIDYVRSLFNDDVEYRNKYLKYKNKYLKYKNKK